MKSHFFRGRSPWRQGRKLFAAGVALAVVLSIFQNCGIKNRVVDSTFFNRMLKENLQFAQQTIPAAPTSVSGVVLSSTQVGISWVSTAASITGFFVQYSTSPNFVEGSYFQQAVPSNFNSVTISNLNTGQLYYFRVLAAGLGVASNPSEIISLAPFSSNFSGNALSSTSILTSWSTIFGSNGYTIEVSNQNSFPIGQTSSYVSAAFSTSYLITGLTSATQYFLRMKANGMQNDWSPAITVTTQSGPTGPPDPPPTTFDYCSSVQLLGGLNISPNLTASWSVKKTGDNPAFTQAWEVRLLVLGNEATLGTHFSLNPSANSSNELVLYLSPGAATEMPFVIGNTRTVQHGAGSRSVTFVVNSVNGQPCSGGTSVISRSASLEAVLPPPVDACAAVNFGGNVIVGPGTTSTITVSKDLNIAATTAPWVYQFLLSSSNAVYTQDYSTTPNPIGSTISGSLDTPVNATSSFSISNSRSVSTGSSKVVTLRLTSVNDNPCPNTSAFTRTLTLADPPPPPVEVCNAFSVTHSAPTTGLLAGGTAQVKVKRISAAAGSSPSNVVVGFNGTGVVGTHYSTTPFFAQMSQGTTYVVPGAINSEMGFTVNSLMDTLSTTNSFSFGTKIMQIGDVSCGTNGPSATVTLRPASTPAFVCPNIRVLGGANVVNAGANTIKTFQVVNGAPLNAVLNFQVIGTTGHYSISNANLSTANGIVTFTRTLSNPNALVDVPVQVNNIRTGAGAPSTIEVKLLSINGASCDSAFTLTLNPP